jgi:hypothetical protein
MFRLYQKHSRNLDQDVAPVSVEKLFAAQSIRAAVTSAIIAVICCNVIWAYTASLSDRFFPWVSILQGVVIGRGVRMYGRGLDWRFPAIAAAAAWIGAFSGNLIIALIFTAAETGPITSSWWQVLDSFFAKTVTIVDVIYALFAVALAMFYSKRRLNRHEVLALRKHAEGKG